MKLARIMLIVAVVMGLLLSGTLPVLAAAEVVSTTDSLLLKMDSNKPPWAVAGAKIIKGEVLAVGVDSITVQSGAETVQIFVVEGSKFKIPNLGLTATLPDIQPGVQVVALVYEEAGKLYARHIAVIPGKPLYRHHVGEVVAYTADTSITIKLRSGEEVTFSIVAGEFKILPPGAIVEVGKWVTVISRRLPVTDELVAKGVVVHPVKPPLTPQEFRERLREHLRWREMELLRLWELERITGPIVSIDETSTALTIDQTAFVYNEDTIIVLKGIIGLQVGQTATAFYQEQLDGTLLAKLVLVKVEPPEIEVDEELEIEETEPEVEEVE